MSLVPRHSLEHDKSQVAHTRKYEVYERYKQSGVKWIGEIPAHWTTGQLKYLVKLVTGGTPPKSDVKNYAGGTIPWVKPADLKGLTPITESSEYLSEAGGQHVTIVPPGSVLICCIGSIGKVGVAGVSLATNQQINAAIIRRKSNWFSRFAGYALVASEEEHKRRATMSVVAILNQSKQGQIPFPIPPFIEQRTIASFLDHKTARIDALIAEKRKLIELLQEKRNALISHAVTKGLNLDVPMKDSGVEWIGEIPAHWEVRRLKFVAQVRSGVAKGRKLNEHTIEMPYLRVANVQDGFLDLSDIATIEIHAHEVERYSLKPGDVLMNEGGDYDKLGRGAVWDGQIDPCLHQNHVFAVRAYSVEPQWLATITLASYAKHYFILHSKQSTNLASISSSNLRELPIIMPPADERKAILGQVEERTRLLSQLVEEVQANIGKLQEYRTALISAAVTGKIDVRDWQEAGVGKVDKLGQLEQEVV